MFARKNRNGINQTKYYEYRFSLFFFFSQVDLGDDLMQDDLEALEQDEDILREIEEMHLVNTEIVHIEILIGILRKIPKIQFLAKRFSPRK